MCTQKMTELNFVLFIRTEIKFIGRLGKVSVYFERKSINLSEQCVFVISDQIRLSFKQTKVSCFYTALASFHLQSRQPRPRSMSQHPPTIRFLVQFGAHLFAHPLRLRLAVESRLATHTCRTAIDIILWRMLRLLFFSDKYELRCLTHTLFRSSGGHFAKFEFN